MWVMMWVMFLIQILNLNIFSDYLKEMLYPAKILHYVLYSMIIYMIWYKNLCIFILK